MEDLKIVFHAQLHVFTKDNYQRWWVLNHWENTIEIKFDSCELNALVYRRNNYPIEWILSRGLKGFREISPYQ